MIFTEKDLFLVFTIFSLFVTITTYVFYIQYNKDKRFKYSCSLWGSATIVLYLDAYLNMDISYFVITILSLAYLTIMYNSVALMGELYNLTIKKRYLALTTLICMVIALVVFFFTRDFFYTSLPVAASIGLPMVYAGILGLKSREKNLIKKMPAFFAVLWGLHYLDYPFLREVESFAIWGFALEILILFGISAQLPMIVHISQQEETEKKLKDKVIETKAELKLTIDELVLAQKKILEQDKFISLATLSSGISHEIRNPLNIILNSANILKESCNGEHPDQCAFIDLIIKNSKKASDIITNMLFQIRENTINLDKRQDLNLKECLQEVLANNTPFQNLDVKITLSIPDEITTNALKTEVETIFLNMAHNAYYSLNKKKNLLGESFKPEFRVTTTRENNRSQTLFYDNGLGIKDEDLKNIFDPFFTTKEVGSGTGLGLALIKKLISDRSGTIEVRSKEGEFCEFKISFPVS